MSRNSLKQLDDDAFDECCENVKILYLSHNEISTLNRRHFEKLRNLEVIFLDSNVITELDANTFQTLKNLTRLNLNRNPIELQGSSSRGFLIQSSLKELNLDDCKIDEIPDGMFVNMTQLEILSLAGNPLDENLDPSPFEPLTSLLKLRIPNLSQSTIYQICDKLTAIDIINFDEFNVSCTVLSDDAAFDEGIIFNDPIEPPKVQSLSPPITKKPTTTEASTTASSSVPLTTLPAFNETSTVDSKRQIETSDGDATNKTKIDTGKASIDIDNDTIKFILVGESNHEDDDDDVLWIRVSEYREVSREIHFLLIKV
jgi:Leucine-rich repeat (LRR) protein